GYRGLYSAQQFYQSKLKPVRYSFNDEAEAITDEPSEQSDKPKFPQRQGSKKKRSRRRNRK
ncbi:MAG: hypothetical protein K2G04_07555, partial [Oscillospiraceae bacterium]|nr:hypothetical protein [Oscillospiraceae bacterium]